MAFIKFSMKMTSTPLISGAERLFVATLKLQIKLQDRLEILYRPKNTLIAIVRAKPAASQVAMLRQSPLLALWSRILYNPPSLSPPRSQQSSSGRTPGPVSVVDRDTGGSSSARAPTTAAELQTGTPTPLHLLAEMADTRRTGSSNPQNTSP